MIAQTPELPYYAVIFTSVRTEGDNGYAEMADRMVELAQTQDGFLGIESAREEIGISVSYWRDVDAIKKWKENVEHRTARMRGRESWYNSFRVRVSKVEYDYNFKKDDEIDL